MENGEESKAHAIEAKDGGEPEYVDRRGPAEDEETGGEKDGAEHHWGKAGFGDGFVVVLFKFAEVEFIVTRYC